MEAWSRDHRRLVKQHAADESEHHKAADRATDIEARLVQLRRDRDAARERLSRANSNDEPDEPSTQERDAAFAALEQVKSMEVEAQLAARSAQEQVSQIAGKAENLRRQAAHERQAKARHEQAMARRRQQAKLAAVSYTHLTLPTKRIV